MPTKINFVSGTVKLLAKDKRKNESIKFDGVVALGNNEQEIRKNFHFERIRGNRENDIAKHVKNNMIALEDIEIVKDLGYSNI